MIWAILDKMNIVLLGPPGIGKTTLANIVASELRIAVICSAVALNIIPGMLAPSSIWKNAWPLLMKTPVAFPATRSRRQAS